MSKTQCDRILDFMQTEGSITQIQALSELGCMRLASRICDLRKRGHIIKKEMVQSKNRYGEHVAFAKYILVE